MNYFERLEVGYSKAEALEMDRMILENRMDELFHKLCCEGGLTVDEKKELDDLEQFFENYYN